MKDRKSERPLWLSEEEALGLLDIVLVAPADLTAEQRTSIAKLSDFCRQFLRNEETNAAGLSATTAVPALYVA